MPIATRRFRATHLVVCLSAAFAVIAAGNARAATLPKPSTFGWDASNTFAGYLSRPSATSGVTHSVASCLDDGSLGTLRQVVGAAASGDTVDLSGLPLTCSTITLSQGEIAVWQSSLTLTGPAARTLTLTNSQVGRILNHSGLGGELSVYNLTLSNAMVYTTSTPAKGGCILSAGSVKLHGASVSGCRAVAYAGTAVGGGIYAAGTVQLSGSSVTGNAAYTYNNGVASGGGIFALNGLSAVYSTVSGNSCSTAPGGLASGGGAYVVAAVQIELSTIDSNRADFGGGIEFVGTSGRFNSVNSTISGNIATSHAGGIEILATTGPVVTTFYNSTVAFNSAPVYAGVRVLTSVAAYGSIIAKNSNTSPASFADLYIKGSGYTLTGQNNLIMASNLVLAGTLTSDPKLTPLANRGGGTRTHGLSLSSPAVNSGGFGAIAPITDQRGSGFLREVPSGKPDIGAYERQASDDELFYGGFD